MSYETYIQLLYAWMGIGVITFFYLLKQDAPYGRHIKPGWGPTLDNRLGWFIMEFTVILVFLYYLCTDGCPQNTIIWVISAFFLFHYLNRSIIFPMRLRTKGKRMPWIIALSAMGFNLANGFFLGYYFAHFAQYPASWGSDPRFWLGMMLFILGLGINWHSDNILINLRKPGQTGYSIPQGGLFRWISCPNHFGEMLEWGGFAVMAWNLPGLCFAVWTIANLAPRALSHHRWYRDQFPDYPSDRRAFIPFLV
ncbi:MAG: DUF1295 domain-containing protein [Chitinophagales bacterium]|nr:DUF1295 domain-containing protein [Chitinophagales bacterium]